MTEYEPEWGDEADVPRIALAMANEKRKGNDPLYLDMSVIPENMRDYFLHSKVRWMDNFFNKLGREAKTDMFGKTPYYPMNQMTKMAIRTGADCRSDVRGLLAAGWRSRDVPIISLAFISVSVSATAGSLDGRQSRIWIVCPRPFLIPLRCSRSSMTRCARLSRQPMRNPIESCVTFRRSCLLTTLAF